MQIIIPEFSRSPYGLVVISAVIIGFIVALLFMRRFGVSKQTMIYTCLLTLVCTIITSLLVVLKYTPEGLRLGFSGLGAAVGMVSGIFISELIIKEKPDLVMASFVASAPLMYGLAKIGCLLAGCCHGKDYSGPLAIVYHGDTEGSYFPVQLIDMAVFIVIFAVSSLLVLKMKNKVKAIYIILGFTIPVRFLLEYLRYYHDGHIIEKGQIEILIAGAFALIIITIWKKVLKINYR